MSDAQSRETFVGHEGSVFRIQRAGDPGALNDEFEPTDLELGAVADRSNEHLDSFSCLFYGSRDRALGQRTYGLKHDKLGELELFLVPVVNPDPEDDRMCYEAAFSRLKE